MYTRLGAFILILSALALGVGSQTCTRDEGCIDPSDHIESEQEVMGMKKSLLQVAKKGWSHLEKAGDWIECDVCDPNGPWGSKLGDVNDALCYPGTSTECLYDTCDPANPKVANRGWYCLRGTSKVIVPSGSFAKAGNGATVLSSTQPLTSIYAGARVIAPGRSYSCVPCAQLGDFIGKWCQPCESGNCLSGEWEAAGATNRLCEDGPCDACAPDDRNGILPGWFCRKGTADVCIDKDGWAVIDMSKATCGTDGKSFDEVPIPGSAIFDLSCKDKTLCNVLVKSFVKVANYAVNKAIKAAADAAAVAAGSLVAEVGAPVFAVWAVQKSTKIAVKKSSKAVVHDVVNLAQVNSSDAPLPPMICYTGGSCGYIDGQRITCEAGSCCGAKGWCMYEGSKGCGATYQLEYSDNAEKACVKCASNYGNRCGSNSLGSRAAGGTACDVGYCCVQGKDKGTNPGWCVPDTSPSCLSQEKCFSANRDLSCFQENYAGACTAEPTPRDEEPDVTCSEVVNR